MLLQDGVFPIEASEYQRVVEVWEASVRATHHFVSEEDIAIFRPLVLAALPRLNALLGVRSTDGEVVGFLGVAGDTIEMLFLAPAWRGLGVGARLLRYAVERCGARRLDVNEQNPQALGFYEHMGFEVIGRSERDGLGKPYPLLHMRLHSNQA